MAKPERAEVVAWSIAGVILLAGVITVAIGLASPVSFGWFAYAPLADAAFTPEYDGVFVARITIIGAIAVGIGLVALAYLAGRRAGSAPRA
jgi:heme/copper-type cytochrome/quinol oxidase subunit 1